MKASGKITKINTELGYGFAQVAKIGDVFFSSETRFESTSFGNLGLGDHVNLEVVETSRGLFAASLTASSLPKKDRLPEAGI